MERSAHSDLELDFDVILCRCLEENILSKCNQLLISGLWIVDCRLQISHLVYLTLANNSVLWVIHCEERMTLLTNY